MFTSTSVIITIILLCFGTLISIIGVLFKKAIFKKLDEVSTETKNTGEKINKLEKELLIYYVRKEDFTVNTQSHKELWIEIGGLKDRLIKEETITSNLKSTIISLQRKLKTD